MTDIASPSHEPSAVEHHDAAPANDNDVPMTEEPAPKPEDIPEPQNIEAQVNGRVEPDATAAPPEESTADAPAVNGADDTKPINGVTDDVAVEANDEPAAELPNTRKRSRDETPPSSARKPKAESPPWKKMGAEGPTSFMEGGRRKSGRTNLLPLELQPPGKSRLTRGARSAHTATPKKDEATPRTKLQRTPATNPRQYGRRGSAAHDTPSTKASSKRQSLPAKTTSRSARKRTPSPRPQGSRHSTRVRRPSSRHDDEEITPTHDSTYYHDTGRSPRLKLRVGRPGEIPLVHPDQARKRAKIGESFEDFWTKAGSIAVEEGGLFASEEGPLFTDDLAVRDARLIMRVEDEVEPGGLLSVGRCSLFFPQGEEEPPRQYARQDHLLKAMVNFRKLLLMEQQRHRVTAKKLAEACRDEWIRRQPKSAEQIEREARDACIIRYRTVAKTIAAMWENVRAQVNRNRLEQWELEEQKRVKAALNEAVNLSEQKLQARREDIDSEMASDDDLDNMSDVTSNMADADRDSDLASNESNSDDGDSEEDSEVMSSDEDSDEENANDKDSGDAGLTQEQLRLKYANMPELDTSAAEEDKTSVDQSRAVTVDETTDIGGPSSDESVDMDDDMGSSDDDDSDSDGSTSMQESDEDDDEEGADGAAGGLLGMFFGKSELKQLKDDAPEHEVTADGDIPMAEVATATDVNTTEAEVMKSDDEISLIQYPDSDVEAATTAPTAEPVLKLEEPAPIAEAAEVDTKEPEATAAEPLPAPREASLELGTDFAESHANIEVLASADSQHKPDVEAALPVEGTETTVAPTAATPPDTIAAAETSDHRQGLENGALEAEDQTMEDVQPSQEPAEPASKLLSPETEHQATPDAKDDAEAQQTSEQTQPVSDAEPMEVEEVSKTTPEEKSLTPSRHKIEIPSLLRGTLREYQRDGLDWLAGLYANNTNGILADEMGLGKTIQTIALLAHLASYHEVWGPHLVIVPTSVMLNWEMEFKKWCPGFKILAYYGTQEERKRKRQGWNNDDVWNVCITSYQLVLQDQQVFKRRRWHYLILDEAHNIKNFKSQRWQTLLGFNTQARLLLTGTPLQNNLTELWSLLFFLMPAENGQGGFADLQEFHDWFHKPESQILESGRDQMDDEARAIISKLHKVLRPYLLRRLKKDVEKQMPGKYEHVEFCRLSKRQRELYDGFLGRTETKDTLASGNYLSIINCLMQLRKVCNHPDLFVDRPIMTSLRMTKSVASDYQFTEVNVRRNLLAKPLMSDVSLSFLNLIPTEHENISSVTAERISQLSSHRILTDLRETQRFRAQHATTTLDPSSVRTNMAYLESASRWGRFEELQHGTYLNALRRQQRPIYGKNVIDLVTIDAYKRPHRPKPTVPRLIMSWFEQESRLINSLTPSLDQRADAYKTIIEKFSCVTPAVVTRDLNQVLMGRNNTETFTEADLRLSAPVRWAPFVPKEPPLDPWHEARMRLSIQFPDKRLLQYDCGKLQKLDKLLRKLQSGGHRALIFTQMTKVLDILEQFLNIHGHKYLRLDGSTKVEQRQILTDRFNHDTRILAFILSTRSGGLGINLTGADTVIFYDQDWNPAMDKQCQDRCHRIGQTRDVHIYRLVSEHTIEANILRKASQKQMLDDVVIQEGEFTTDQFNKASVRDVLGEKLDMMSEGVSAADAALDRVLGGPDHSNSDRAVGRVFEQAEDREDVVAARQAEKEIQADDADFTEKANAPASGASTARQGTPLNKPGAEDDDLLLGVDEGDVEYNAWGERIGNIDQYMLAIMAEELKYTRLELPKDKKKAKKKGRDTRRR